MNLHSMNHGIEQQQKYIKKRPKLENAYYY